MTEEDKNRLGWQLWEKTASEQQRHTVVKLMKERYKTFKEIDTALVNGEWSWLYVAPKGK